MAEFRRGDRFVQQHPEAWWPLFIKVTRVAKDGSWVDIRVFTWAASWAKRVPDQGQLLKTDPHLTRRNWTPDEIPESCPDELWLQGPPS
jgi:hypothetical protein